MQSKSDIKNLKYIVLSTLLIIASLSFMKTTIFVLKSNQRFEDLRAEVADLEKDKAYINEELEFKKSPDFIEQEARNKLNMLKPNERVYVFEDGTEQKEVLGETADTTIVDVASAPNWKLWADLLF